MGSALLAPGEPELQDNEVPCRNVCTSIYLHEPTEAQQFEILKFSVNPSPSELSRLTVK